MAKLLSERAADKYYAASQDWLIGEEFKLIVFNEEEYYTFFVEDKTGKISSLKLIPKFLNELELTDDQGITITPSVDTCGISVPKIRHREVFKLLENYLLAIEKKRRKH